MLAFFQGELVAKVDQELTVAESLPSWQHHNAREVEIVLRILLLTEVADHVVAIWLTLAKDIKVESVDLIPNVLMIQEKLGDVAQVLRVNFLLFRIELKHAHCVIPVDLITWWTSRFTPLRVLLQLVLVYKVEETEGADVEHSAVVLWREVRVIPSFHRDISELNVLNRFEPSR